ncbi:cob(I)yrinic acid a,c-diamide adenosyltransferase [Halopseudomonas aestusnigri]|jgi:cob(I)alamin adenosyltransferase|uniref:Corrinoid adenosyltransferase n=1 Tax=Halopseudomonas aestusnigri TaxID=857252 RepID=A0AAQ1G7E3_9GAMM|nr:cob(I)yrinic acid a,c-diamide adenosyltransferase [Halopseudomonas aestusnigri]MEE2798706.1 cob(I)yrinic acid a,c-diamide adenosyltransferase [Pseudomonadota bacterium]OWL88928.1 ATP:cob(I)alamin adenosyltransferase [Halopseudomonas aestusnigri]SEG32602.1 cob(I)alamin adenosyltransferase [Halopseudomonas aestusnigri]|tara:strand:- start:1559 stop:2125 length:567 start_codon:yes stop_codon:yes gene_type:complete
MGYRLSKLYTRTGDAGDTGLANGQRIRKDHPRVEAMGDVDELNSQLGLLLCQMDSDRLAPLKQALSPIQHRLFDLGGELAIPGHDLIEAADVTALEQLIDQFNAELEPLKNFILPGGSVLVAQAHLTRSVCRRAERHYLTLAMEEEVNNQSAIYLNRLSDLLFVAARTIALLEGTAEVLWAAKPKPEA